MLQCTVTMTKDGYELCADRNYSRSCDSAHWVPLTMLDPGEEILATYGAHTNDKLIVHCESSVKTPSDVLQR